MRVMVLNRVDGGRLNLGLMGGRLNLLPTKGCRLKLHPFDLCVHVFSG